MTGRSTTSVTLRWTGAVGGAAGYGVYIDGTFVLNVSAVSITLTGLNAAAPTPSASMPTTTTAPGPAEITTTTSTDACATAAGGGGGGGSTDVLPPTAPLGLVKGSSTQTSIAVSWTASSDNVGVAGYGLYRNGSAAGSSIVTVSTFSGLDCGTTYTLAVDAYDAAGNRSGKTSLSAATSACAGGGDTTAPLDAWTLTKTGSTHDVDLGLVGASDRQCRRRRLRPLPERLLDGTSASTSATVHRARLRVELRARGRRLRRRRQPQRPGGG